MNAAIINSLGLIMDIIGAYLIFRYGLPENISRTGSVYLINGKVDEAEKTLAKRYDQYSRAGFILLILGFVVQLVSNWV